MDFSQALSLVKMTHKVRRESWIDKEFIFLVPGSTFKVNRPPLLGIYDDGTEVNYHPHIDVKFKDGPVMPWIPNQDDLMAEDWIPLQ